MNKVKSLNNHINVLHYMLSINKKGKFIYEKRISKVLVMIIMFSLITSLIPMNQTNVSCAATYLGNLMMEPF